MTRWGRHRMNRAAVDVADGNRIGIDKKSGKRIALSDVDTNKHALVLGTIGIGKTVSVLNMVESAINRELPVVYVDGKGDHRRGGAGFFATTRSKATCSWSSKSSINAVLVAKYVYLANLTSQIS